MTVPAWPGARRRRWPRRLGAAVAVTVVLGAGAYATLRLLDDARGGGADSPEAAAEALLAAVTSGDALGVLDLLPDGERRALVDAVDELATAGDRVGFLADGFGLDAVPGVDVAVPDPVTDVRTLAGGIAAVEVTTGGVGSASLGLDLGALLGPVGDRLGDGLRATGAVPTIGVVEDDGGWRPSLVVTGLLLADPLLQGFDADDPVEPDGAGSPLGAVADLLDALADDEPRAALAVLDPAEVGPWQALAAVPEAPLGPFALVVTDADVDDLGGGAHRIVPTALRFEHDDLTITLADGCVTVRRADEGGPAAETERCGDDLPPELDELADVLAPIRTGFVTVERDGEHFVSPLRTAVDLAAAGFRGLEPGDVDADGIVVEALSGGLNAVVADLLDDIAADLEPDERPRPGPEDDDEPPADDDVPLRTPTGATGPDGALVAGDVVSGELEAGDTTTFTVVAGGGEGYVGAQATDDADLTIRVTDAATGEELDANDDFVGQDPEAFVRATQGQRLTVEVAGFDDAQTGGFVVYYEQ